MKPTQEKPVRRDGYKFCEKHQQEYRQYCSGCAIDGIVKPKSCGKT